MSLKAIAEKFLKHALTALPGGLLLVLQSAPSLTEVNWASAANTILVVCLSAGIAGAGLNTAQGNTKKPATVA